MNNTEPRWLDSALRKQSHLDSFPLRIFWSFRMCRLTGRVGAQLDVANALREKLAVNACSQAGGHGSRAGRRGKSFRSFSYTPRRLTDGSDAYALGGGGRV
jgi:hypothetical protein